MTEFPKHPTDFVAMMQPFEDDDIEKLLQQDVEKVSRTIDMLKRREINATLALQNIKKGIEEKIELLKIQLEEAGKDEVSFFVNILEDEIKNLYSLL